MFELTTYSALYGTHLKMKIFQPTSNWLTGALTLMMTSIVAAILSAL